LIPSLAALVAAVACGSSSSTSPSLTASVSSPSPVTPANNTTVANLSQPVTLIVQNAVVTKSGGNVYTFEVATDTGFASKVQTKDGVAEGSSGETGVRLDALAAGTTYYWHSRVTGGGTTGLFGPMYKFSIGPAIVVNPPAPIAPLTNAQTSPRPALRVTNATRSGPVGAITYKFEIAKDAAFGTIIVTATNTEGVNETGYLPTSDLPTNTLLYWRATAIDATNGIASAPSPAQSFTAIAFSQADALAAQLGIVLWPGAVPPGTIGHATMGSDPAFGAGWQIQTLYYAPGNVHFQSPSAEMLRIFDLLDRNYDPDGAAAWMNANGYPTAALWYPPPEKAVIGLQYVYIAARGKNAVNGTWDVVVRVE
jgi:hypothetical protein